MCALFVWIGWHGALFSQTIDVSECPDSKPVAEKIVREIIEPARKELGTSKFKYRLRITPDDEIDAHIKRTEASPDLAEITISKGLLAFVKSLDELAFVLFHEMSHDVRGHFFDGRDLRYSMNHEYEADHFGFKLLLAMKYSPQGAFDFFLRLRSAGSSVRRLLFDYLNTHPQHEAREHVLRAALELLEQREAKHRAKTDPFWTSEDLQRITIFSEEIDLLKRGDFRTFVSRFEAKIRSLEYNPADDIIFDDSFYEEEKDPADEDELRKLFTDWLKDIEDGKPPPSDKPFGVNLLEEPWTLGSSFDSLLEALKKQLYNIPKAQLKAFLDFISVPSENGRSLREDWHRLLLGTETVERWEEFLFFEVQGRLPQERRVEENRNANKLLNTILGRREKPVAEPAGFDVVLNREFLARIEAADHRGGVEKALALLEGRKATLARLLIRSNRKRLWEKAVRYLSFPEIEALIFKRNLLGDKDSVLSLVTEKSANEFQALLIGALGDESLGATREKRLERIHRIYRIVRDHSDWESIHEGPLKQVGETLQGEILKSGDLRLKTIMDNWISENRSEQARTMLERMSVWRILGDFPVESGFGEKLDFVQTLATEFFAQDLSRMSPSTFQRSLSSLIDFAAEAFPADDSAPAYVRDIPSLFVDRLADALGKLPEKQKKRFLNRLFDLLVVQRWSNREIPEFPPWESGPVDVMDMRYQITHQRELIEQRQRKWLKILV